MTPRLLPRGLAAVALGSSAALALAACGSSSSGGGSGSASGSSKSGATNVTIRLTDGGCSPARLTARAGPINFNVQGDSGSVTEMELRNRSGIILGERENIVQGLNGSFSLNVQPGTYVMNCPAGDKEDNGTLVVTGAATSAAAGPPTAELQRATDGYMTYVAGESQVLLSDTRQFVAALKAGNTARARELFGPTRINYEAIEPVAESFGNLDPEIDARINDVSNPSQWTGFHRIEQILWQRNTTAGTERYADKLLADVTTLANRTRTLRYQAAQLANGAVELLNEVANSKITGEEDRYSHTDLSDFEGNLSGAERAFELLAPALRQRGDGALVTEVTQRFADVQRTLDVYRRNTPLGYAVYSELTSQDRRKLAQQVDALAEPLSTVAARVTS